MIDRRLLLSFDWKIFLLTLIIAAIGIAEIYSTTNPPVATEIAREVDATEPRVNNPYPVRSQSQNFWEKQMLWVGIGIGVLLLITLFDYHSIVKYGYFFYALAMILLVSLFVLGVVRSGSKRWIDVGFFSVQPSEIVKLSLVICLAKYFGESKKKDSYTLTELVVPFVFILPPFLMILLQPDLGTAVSLMLISVCIIFAAGIKKRSALYAGLFGLASSAVMWNFLKGYQKQRILSFFDPSKDPLGTGYHTLQSEIAIGSGGIAGRGFLNGTQGQLNFLPEHHTDFIFSIIAEEWGFLGSLVFLILIFTLVYFCIQASRNAKDRIAALLCFGITAMLSLNVIINIGMAVGLLPIVGVPLPLVSYGGSSILATMIGIGLILNVQMRRYLI